MPNPLSHTGHGSSGVFDDILAYLLGPVDQFLYVPLAFQGQNLPRCLYSPVDIHWDVQSPLDCELLESRAPADLGLWILTLIQGLAHRGLFLMLSPSHF